MKTLVQFMEYALQLGISVEVGPWRFMGDEGVEMRLRYQGRHTQFVDPDIQALEQRLVACARSIAMELMVPEFEPRREA